MELIAMKKSRKAPREGDVFVVQPFPGIFYYGKVIQTNIRSKDSFVNGMLLIYVYDRRSTDKSVPADLDGSRLLIAPTIVNRLGWSRGYFETISNSPVTEKERNVSFGFWSFRKKCFVDAEGTPLQSDPEYYTDYGLGNHLVVEDKIQAALKQQ